MPLEKCPLCEGKVTEVKEDQDGKYQVCNVCHQKHYLDRELEHQPEPEDGGTEDPDTTEDDPSLNTEKPEVKEAPKKKPSRKKRQPPEPEKQGFFGKLKSKLNQEVEFEW